MELKKAAALLEKVIEKKSSYHIIRYALYKEGYLIGTNLDNWVHIDINIAAGELAEQCFLVDVQLLKKTGSLELARIATSTEDFPECEEDLKNPWQLPAGLFYGSLSRFKNYCSIDTPKGILQAVYFNPAKQEIVATDGHRMRVDRFNGIIPLHLYIPVSALNTIDTIEVKEAYAADDKIRVQGEDVVFLFKQIEGQYPDYNRYIPREKGIVTTISESDIKEMIAALETLKPLVNPKTKLVFFNGNKVFSLNRDRELSNFVQLSKSFFGNDEGPIRIGFNLDILLDILKSLEGPQDLRTTDQANAVTFTNENRDKLFLIMPLRVIGFHTDYEEKVLIEKDIAEAKEVEVEKRETKKATAKPKINKTIEKLCIELQNKIGVDELINILEMLG